MERKNSYKEREHHSIEDFKGITAVAQMELSKFMKEHPNAKFDSTSPFAFSGFGTCSYADTITYYPNGTIWYGVHEKKYSEEVTTPEDYKKIFDDKQKTKKFIAEHLDKGPIMRDGRDDRGDKSRADYPLWLYTYSENKEFRNNFAASVSELLIDELSKKQPEYEHEKSLEKVTEKFNEGYHKGSIEHAGKLLTDGDMRDALWRNGLDYNLSSEDEEFKKYFVEELGKTIRPWKSFEEFLEKKWGKPSNEQNMLAAKRGFEYDNEHPAIHFSEASEEFKRSYKKRYLKREAVKNGVREIEKDTVRLSGLLQIAEGVIYPDEKFENLKNIFIEKIKEGLFKNTPEVEYTGIPDYYAMLLKLTASIQNTSELDDFWINEINNSGKAEHSITAIDALLVGQKDVVARRKKIPDILDAIQSQTIVMDQEQAYAFVPGLLTSRNMLAEAARVIATLCEEKKKHVRISRDAKVLDILQDFEIGSGEYTFTYKRYSAEDVQEKTARINLYQDLVTGDAELKDTIDNLLEKGFPINNSVMMTSLESQKTEKGYRGILALNQTYFPFLLENNGSKFEMGKILESKTVLFGDDDRMFEDRKIGLENYEDAFTEDFGGAELANTRINMQVEIFKEEGRIGAGVGTLKNKLDTQSYQALKSTVEAIVEKYSENKIFLDKAYT